MSSFLYVTKTVQLPVRSSGRVILNAAGEKVAEATDSFMADSMVVLMNYGSAIAKQVEDKYDAMEAKKASMLFGGK